MEISNTESVKKLLKLQQGFKKTLPDRIKAIEENWHSVVKKQSHDFSNLQLKLHSLVGSAGTFGASMVSISARKLEAKIRAILYKELILDNESIISVEQLMSDLHDIAEAWQPSDIPFVPEILYEKKKKDNAWNSNIYLVEDDIELANLLIEFLENAGYSVIYYQNITDFKKDYGSHEKSSAIIMDMAFDEGVVAGAETIKYLSEVNNDFPPVIFISVHDDIQARLAAAQAGASRYFTKPIDKEKLLSTLDLISNRIKFDPYRVIVIDDDEAVLEFYSSVLQKVGMDVLSFSNPIEAYKAIKEFNPELIVLDLYMPECSGLELASVIRQDDDNFSIPIVFLSTETDVRIQLSAIDLGGDDFLVKPLEVKHFIQAVTARVKRSRTVNDLTAKIQNTMRESEYRLIALDQHAIISMTDLTGRIIFVNQHFSNISGYSEEELLDENHRMLKSGKHSADFYDELWVTISNGKVWNGQICNLNKNGTEYWVEATIVPFMDENGIPYKYVSARTDITRVKESEEKAEKANMAKSNFLANISHELRTPLNAICGFTQLLVTSENQILNNSQKEYIDEIAKASDHLLSLIVELLDFSNIESGHIALLIESVNATHVLNECLSLLSIKINSRKLKISFMLNGDKVLVEHISELEIMLNVDRKRLKQIFINLLSNAIKYNRDGGDIKIAIDTYNGKIRFSITDTGMGISKQNKNKLFSPFTQLIETPGVAGGSGIGLVICKKLVELMDGKIGVESQLDIGSTFWFEFTEVN